MKSRAKERGRGIRRGSLLGKHTAVDLVGILVRDLNAELLLRTSKPDVEDISTAAGDPTAAKHGTGGVVSYLLDSHHNLHGVQAVQTQVVGEVRRFGDLPNKLRLELGRRLTGTEIWGTHVVRVVDLLREMSASAQDTRQGLHRKSITGTAWMLRQHGHGSAQSHPFTVPAVGEHPVLSKSRHH